jgi:threonine/homoserine/homoserine lactone efflux protein
VNTILPSAGAGFGLGVVLASAPGPVQAVLLSESVRGGLPRGFRAQLGANITFALLLLSLALGLSLAAPTGTALRALKVIGGTFLLLIAADVFRSRYEVDAASPEGRTLSPAARGTLAVVLNPGAWLFLATAASSLLSNAAHVGGTASAISAALALSVGIALGDTAVVLFGGIGLRRAGERVTSWLPRALAAVLAGLGIWLVVDGIIS